MKMMSKKQVESILEELRPAIQADGGDVHLVDITTDGVVQVRFEGECLRCPSRDMTLRSGIERPPSATGSKASRVSKKSKIRLPPPIPPSGGVSTAEARRPLIGVQI